MPKRHVFGRSAILFIPTRNRIVRETGAVPTRLTRRRLPDAGAFRPAPKVTPFTQYRCVSSRRSGIPFGL